MNKIQYKAMYPAYYELREGVKLDFNGINFAYTEVEDYLVVSDMNSGVRLPGTYKDEKAIYKFLEEKSDKLNELMSQEGYKKLSERFDFLVTKEEYWEMASLFEECIGIPASHFYNDATLMTTNSIKFDMVKFESYLYKSNPDYYVGMSCKEFVEKKYGQELLDVITYFMKL